MPKSANQKLKLLYLLKILEENTDENHVMSMSQLIEALQKNGISAERKSIYDDVASLQLFGIDVECRRGNGGGYYLASRQFELPELKLLVDSVQASKFLTVKKSRELIKKLEAQCSRYEASQLQRQVFVSNRIKTMNESIYYVVDEIHQAISCNSQISFLYAEWTTAKTLIYRKNGERYVVSPWALIWDDENYYLVAYDAVAGKIKHYRVDKISSIEQSGEKRLGAEEYGTIDTALYSKKLFGMYGGKNSKVKLEFKNELVGVVLDRFGKDVMIKPLNHDYFTIVVDVVVSKQFLGWIYGLGEGVRIISPEDVIEEMKQEAKRILSLYN